MFTCFHCGSKTVLWDQDFSYDDCGYDGDGLVQFFHCENCNAFIEYRIPFDEPETATDIDGR